MLTIAIQTTDPPEVIKLRPATIRGLQLLIAQTNAQQAADLTPGQWIALHLRELIIAPQLAAAVDEMRKKAEQDANAAFTAAAGAERDRLLAELF